MIQMPDVTKLRQLRESLGVTQEQFSRRTRSVNLRTYIRAEQGITSVRHNTATQILETMNAFLSDAGKPPITLDDLGLKLF